MHRVNVYTHVPVYAFLYDKKLNKKGKEQPFKHKKMEYTTKENYFGCGQCIFLNFFTHSFLIL